MYSYTLDLILLLPCHSTPVLPKPCLARCVLGPPTLDFGSPRPLTLQNSKGVPAALSPTLRTRLGLHSAPCLALVPVTGPANVQQTGSQPACRTRLLVPPLVARSDSSQSYIRDIVGSLVPKGASKGSQLGKEFSIQSPVSLPIRDCCLTILFCLPESEESESVGVCQQGQADEGA